MAGNGGFPKPLVYFFVGLILLNLLSGLASDPDFAEDFPLFAAIGAFLLFRFFTSRNGNRRGPVPMPRPVPEPTAQEPPKDLGFKIPPLRGAPKDTQTEAQPSDEELDILRRESYERHLAEKQAREEKMEQELQPESEAKAEELGTEEPAEPVDEVAALKEQIQKLEMEKAEKVTPSLSIVRLMIPRTA